MMRTLSTHFRCIPNSPTVSLCVTTLVQSLFFGRNCRVSTILTTHLWHSPIVWFYSRTTHILVFYFLLSCLLHDGFRFSPWLFSYKYPLAFFIHYLVLWIWIIIFLYYLCHRFFCNFNWLSHNQIFHMTQMSKSTRSSPVLGNKKTIEECRENQDAASTKTRTLKTRGRG